MRDAGGPAWLGLPVALLLAALVAPGAGAADASVALEGVSVRYDDARWQATGGPRHVLFTPIGKEMRRMDPVDLRVVDGNGTCTDLALQAFAFGQYDTDGMASVPIKVGGVAGDRFAAHTGCRNATPQGVVICVKSGGYAYLLQSLNPGCSGRNLFSDVDPLDEIARGISFSPTAR